ncbi:hypothetical protein BXZ70DRAFT_1006035 [Cristinia sonorae]|uniref:Uncharacterized protein n=1 Tax=Cristinia sonorae TaxID=1940300 RepID=A0A8K0UUD1_9AGAR|nr:hypothetical protein BXZ70DRAFT_1006035 [Cristinia sonorae]
MSTEEQQVRSWGFSHVFTWTDKPRAYYKPHSHNGITTHLILSGNLTICYPEDDPGKKETHGAGERLDVPANKVHEVWVGDEGCTMVIGE